MYARLDIEQHISGKTHISNLLRLWVKIWCQSHLCGCS